jgi:5-methylcytosine-specific restriction endonuclease McrA
VEPPRWRYCGDECYYEAGRRRARENRRRRKAQGLSTSGGRRPPGSEREYRPHTDKVTRGRRVSIAMRRRIIERDKFCRICGKDFGTWPIHIDHIIPAAFGGTDHPDNLRATHAYCNFGRAHHSVWAKYRQILKDRGDWPYQPRA